MQGYIKQVWILLLLTGLLSCKQKKATLFQSLPAEKTGINFINKPLENAGLNILYYLYYYNGGGVATGDINNDGLPDIYFTANSPAGNRLYLNKGNFQFEDVTAKAGVAGTADWSTGASMADVNGDRFLDIYVCASTGHHGLRGKNQLFINNKNGSFTESAAAYGLDFAGFGTQAAFFDFDRDGDLDCYLLNHSQRPHANIADTSARRVYSEVSGNRLFRNDVSTAGKFTDISAAAGIYQSALCYGLGIAIADLNQDGWDDIYIGNDFHENDYYYINNGNGSFTESGAKHFMHYSRFSMGNDVADIDNDGQPDLVTVDMLPPDEKILKTYGSDENADTYEYKLTRHGYQQQVSRNCLQRNNGKGSSFSERALLSNIAATDWSWSPLFADLDNDGNKDLLITSGIVKRPVDLDYIKFVSDLVMKTEERDAGKLDKIAIDKMPDGASHPFLFRGNGNADFNDVSEDWGTAALTGYHNGAAYADFDNDGDLDIVINNLLAPAILLQNNATPKHSITINCKGTGANPFGIGTKIWVFAAGKTQYQALQPVHGFQSSSDLRLHFGLDSLAVADSLLIVWPDQHYQVLKQVPVKGFITVNQQEAIAGFDYDRQFPPPAPLLENMTGQWNSPWKHNENIFVDYNKQYLIPHALSTLGPKMAVADVDGDGLDDIYVCGAAGQSGQLLLQRGNGFVKGDSTAFNRHAAAEENDASFYDANGDGYPDLVVVTGGNEKPDGDSLLADHLYLNDGKGHFIESISALPAILRNKSTVAPGDIDNDGDTDLFLGVLADASKYGIRQTSYLLLNDGKGRYAPAPAGTIQLDSIGMVHASSFADINGDGWSDLVVAGEWMPIKIFYNDKGRFTATDIPGSTGLWQSLWLNDANSDGKLDIYGGNWGLNSKLAAGKIPPLKLYVKDFDKNGSTEQIMAYTLPDKKEYTFLAKDELERALPVLKKAYLQYSEVAGKDVQYMFYDLFTNYKEERADMLASTLFLNQGNKTFTTEQLPEALQLAPLFAFNSAGNEQVLAAGNFFGVIPYEGRYDAQLPTLFSTRKPLRVAEASQLLPLAGIEIRDIKWIRTANNKQLLVLASNNGPLYFFKQ